MNITLWVLQGLLALHTAAGAFWKFSNSEQSVASLKAIPHGGWIALSIVELLCVLGLIAPVFHDSLAKLVPVAAVLIALEMLLFCGLHLASGQSNHNEMIYWLVVAAFSAFIAYGRLIMSPYQTAVAS